MLRDDAAWLIEQYRDEIPARPSMPYVQLDGPGPYRAVRREEPFRLHDVLGVVPQLWPLAKLAFSTSSPPLSAMA